MKLVRPACAYHDDRGEIIDILKDEIHYVTLIKSARGSTRGNHYHKKTVQYVYILEGKMKLLSQMPEAPAETSILEKGDLALNEPWEKHSLTALEDTVFLVFTRGVRGGDDYEKDTFRLEKPLEE